MCVRFYVSTSVPTAVAVDSLSFNLYTMASSLASKCDIQSCIRRDTQPNGRSPMHTRAAGRHRACRDWNRLSARVASASARSLPLRLSMERTHLATLILVTFCFLFRVPSSVAQPVASSRSTGRNGLYSSYSSYLSICQSHHAHHVSEGHPRGASSPRKSLPHPLVSPPLQEARCALSLSGPRARDGAVHTRESEEQSQAQWGHTTSLLWLTHCVRRSAFPRDAHALCGTVRYGACGTVCSAASPPPPPAPPQAVDGWHPPRRGDSTKCAVAQSGSRARRSMGRRCCNGSVAHTVSRTQTMALLMLARADDRRVGTKRSRVVRSSRDNKILRLQTPDFAKYV